MEKGLVFKSEVTGATYYWNQFSVICVGSAHGRELGQLMNGFNNVDLEYIYWRNEFKEFMIGSARYFVLGRIKDKLNNENSKKLLS